MLTQLRLKNFKAWKDTGDVPLKPITGFFGANSSGKSSLIQALLLLKQTADSSDRGIVFHFGDSRTPADLGDFASVVHGHKADSELEISLKWAPGKRFVVRDEVNRQPIVQSGVLGFHVTSRMESSGYIGKPVVDEMSYSVGKAGFGMRRKNGNEYRPFAENTDFEFTRYRGRPRKVTSLDKCYGFPPELWANFRNLDFLADLEYGFEDRLRSVHYLGPLRARPARVYTWSGAQPTDVGWTGEHVIDALLAGLERNQTVGRGHGNPCQSLVEYVAEWLKKLGLIHEFRIEPVVEGSNLFEVKVRKSPGAAESLITDVGFGVSQVLPALVLCFYVPEGSTVILEQPEIHLHPLAQSGLADAFIEASKRRKVQIIVESHSEHLLNRLQRRIAEEELSHEDVGLYFCEPSDGASKLSTLNVDKFGNIANWPENFFGDQFREIASMSRAALKRQRAGE